MTTQTSADRLALIRETAKKFQAKQKKLAHFKREESVNTKSHMYDTNEDERYWTDAPKYAEKYYGEVYRQTTRYDNDWD